jgi:hypothetical protein
MMSVKDLYKNLFERVAGDPYLREMVENAFIDIEDDLYQRPETQAESIEVSELLDEDGDSDEDMYLSRLGYIDEEKPKPEHTRTLRASLNSESSYRDIRYGRYVSTPYTETCDAATHYNNRREDEYICVYGIPPEIGNHLNTDRNICETHRQNISRDESERILTNIFHTLESIIINDRPNISFSNVRDILKYWVSNGIIDGYHLDNDYLSHKFRIIMDKGQYRQSFFISSHLLKY